MQLSWDELLNEKNINIIDIRDSFKYKLGHISNAINISYYEKGEEKHGISAPKFGVVSEGNAIYFLNTGYSSDSFIIKDGYK